MGSSKSSAMMMLKTIWQTWDIRGLVMMSLGIQACLTILAPCRKRYNGFFLQLVLWLLYLCADTVALFTIGKISANISSTTTGAGTESATPPSPSSVERMGPAYSPDLLAFWAPFLLLHLGGPDSITALALEDNELWLRHTLQLMTQTLVTSYVFGRSFGNYKSKSLVYMFTDTLLLPTLLMFFDGLYKYWERTYALYHASANNFRNSLRIKPEEGPNHARLVDEYSSAVAGFVPATFEGLDHPDPLDVRAASEQGQSCGKEDLPDGPTQRKGSKEDTPMVLDAYHFYNKFRGILADQYLSFKDCDESRRHFLRKPEEAFRIIEIQLNLIYDVFYTKVVLLQRGVFYGRVLTVLSATAALLLFWIKDKKNYNAFDVGITFALLLGGLALDLVALVMFLASDWPIIIPSSNPTSSLLQLLAWLTKNKCCSRIRSLPRKRWSESISKYNLLDRCCKDLPSCFNRICMNPLKETLVGLLYVKQTPMDKRLKDFILDELNQKAQLATSLESIHEVCSARGNFAFQDEYVLVSEYFSRWTVDMDYDESLLTWHLATDLCFWEDKIRRKQNEQNDDKLGSMHRDLSKSLSDYMSYLLLRQRALVSPVVGMSDIRFDDTCIDVKKLSNGRLRTSWRKLIVYCCKKLRPQCISKDHEGIDILEKYCKEVLNKNGAIPPITPKDHKSKSVYHEACYLANQLKKLGESQWEITTKVWVELLCYAAVRCSPRSHVAVLNKGGELITIVWLLMIHLGLTQHFSKDRGLSWWIKLTIPK